VTSIKETAHLIRSWVARHPALLAPFRPLVQLGVMPSCAWKRLPVDFRFERPVFGGRTLRYRSHVGDAIGRTLYWRGALAYEEETTAVFVKLVQSARCFLDIGANTGFFALLGCTVNTRCEAHCFEPVPHIFQALQTNIEFNDIQDRCHAVMAAVSNRDGATKFHIPAVGFPSSASLDPGGFRGYAGDLVDVRVLSIDTYLDDGVPVDLVKIDTEGFEDTALQGMRRILHKWHPDLIIECIPDGPTKKVEWILREHGYRFFHLLDSGPFERSSIEPDTQETFRNYLCTARETTLTHLASPSPCREAA
jgi:FkbM family methyltransferase